MPSSKVLFLICSSASILCAFCGGNGGEVNAENNDNADNNSDTDTDNNTNTENINGDHPSELLGQWMQSYDFEPRSFEFWSDGTCEWDGGWGIEECTWSESDGMLTWTSKDSDVETDDNGEIYYFEQTETFNSMYSIVDGYLYLDVLKRISGNSPNLDGTWKNVIKDSEFGVYGEIDFDNEEVDTITIEISGNSYAMTENEAGWYEEDGVREDFNETVNTEGSVLEADNVIVFADSDSVVDISDMSETDIASAFEVYGYWLNADTILLWAASYEEADNQAYAHLD
jgi:hypothetical protein